MKEYEILVETINPCGGEGHEAGDSGSRMRKPGGLRPGERSLPCNGHGENTCRGYADYHRRRQGQHGALYFFRIITEKSLA